MKPSKFHFYVLHISELNLTIIESKMFELNASLQVTLLTL